ncbi:kinesin-like protein KIF18A [Dermacentor silvarum]|uniref:kinesin-like protein KIF18A n=1 Tax=Dermacentor silvarum TaxID=543639 RepID=UPI00189B7BB2|nr:kinesin-like protein KIF18A [Dermacentor silvarum]
MQESTVVPSDLKRRSNETAHSSAPKRRRSNKDQLSPGVRVHLAVRVRLLSYRDSATDSIVLVVITPAPMVKPTPATSRHPTTEESTMVSPNRKRHSNEAAQSSATKRRRSRKEPPSSEVRVNVRVNVRLLSVRDLQTPSIVRVLDYRCHVFDPKAEAESFHFEGGGNVKPNVDQTFMFYQFFDETEDHVYVFENTTWGMLTMLLEGCNCSVLACISRGTDKAFALLGSEECPGVLSLMASQLYQRVLKLRSEGQTCALAVPCLEVYNKVFQEMLCLDPAKGIAILNLTIHKVTEAGTILELFFKGNKNRSQHATDAHAESSSSHAIFESYVTVTENVTRSDARGTKLNLSLLALGNCIDARAKNGTQQVPYQDFKLTHILKDSLGGSGNAHVIGTATALKLSALIEEFKQKVEGLERKLEKAKCGRL